MKIDWQLKEDNFPINKKKLTEVVKTILKEKGIGGKIELGISIVDDKEIRQLNEVHMKKKGTTDVLSFPLEKEKGPDGIIRLGDIVINIQQARRQAKKKEKTIGEEIEFLLNHGLLHLLGFHHD